MKRIVQHFAVRVFLARACSDWAREQKPNIIVMVADDSGYRDMKKEMERAELHNPFRNY